jgi:hypothetical protein
MVCPQFGINDSAAVGMVCFISSAGCKQGQSSSPVRTSVGVAIAFIWSIRSYSDGHWPCTPCRVLAECSASGCLNSAKPRKPDELDEGEKPATADSDGLRGFLEGEVLPWLKNRKKELVNRPLIREQAFGESLDPDKLERLGRYEVHLDRKLERMLAMLLRLKDPRQETIAG